MVLLEPPASLGEVLCRAQAQGLLPAAAHLRCRIWDLLCEVCRPKKSMLSLSSLDWEPLASILHIVQ